MAAKGGGVMAGSTKRAEQKAATRAILVRVSRHLFEAQGYEPVSIRDIAKAASMSTGAIFASFKGKRELYEEAVGPIPPDVLRFLYGPTGEAA